MGPMERESNDRSKLVFRQPCEIRQYALLPASARRREQRGGGRKLKQNPSARSAAANGSLSLHLQRERDRGKVNRSKQLVMQKNPKCTPRKLTTPCYPTRVTPPELVRVGPVGAPTPELLRDTDGEITPPADPGRLLLRCRPDRCGFGSSCAECCRCEFWLCLS